MLQNWRAAGSAHRIESRVLQPLEGAWLRLLVSSAVGRDPLLVIDDFFNMEQVPQLLKAGSTDSETFCT